MHAVWTFLLSDADFLHAYTYGIVIKCVDGIERRVFPRLFTYSADYPEKYVILLSGIPNLTIILQSSSSYHARQRVMSVPTVFCAEVEA